MTTYGMTATGWVKKTLAQTVASLQAGYRAEFGPNVRLQGRRSTFGGIVTVTSPALSALWDALEAVLFAIVPKGAKGAWLHQLGALFGGLAPLAAASTTLAATATGTPGTSIPEGSLVTLTGTQLVFRVTSSVVLAGDTALALEAVDTGPIEVSAGADWTITTPVVGWDAVTNATAASPGRDEEKDGEFLQRFLSSRQAAGFGSARAMRAQIGNLSGVVSASVVENLTAFPTDAQGRRPGEVELFVVGGEDQALGEGIWRVRASGTRLVTTADIANQVSVTVTDEEGEDHVVVFSRPATLDVWVEFYTASESPLSTSDLDAIKAAILEYGEGLEQGDDVLVWSVAAAAAASTVRVQNVIVRLGLTAAPVGESNVEIASNQRAVLHADRVLVQGV